MYTCIVCPKFDVLVLLGIFFIPHAYNYTPLFLRKGNSSAANHGYPSFTYYDIIIMSQLDVMSRSVERGNSIPCHLVGTHVYHIWYDA